MLFRSVGCNRQNITISENLNKSAATPAARVLAAPQFSVEDQADVEQPQHFSGHLRDDAAPQTAPWIPVASEGKVDALAPTRPNSQLSSEKSKRKRFALLSVAAGTAQHKGRGTLASLLSAAARQGRKQAISAPVPATKPGPQPTERQQHQEQ